jgi:phage terminase large subunit
MASAALDQTVVIPYKPRPLQRAIHDLLDRKRFVVAVCHRRFGKSVLAVNHLVRRALMCQRERPRTAYIGPTYRQTKAVVWDYAQFYSRPVPGHAINQSELRIDFPNSGQLRLYGADNPDSMRGIYLDDFVGDEFGMQPAKTFTEVLRPALSDRQGGGLIIGTPNGKNQFQEMAEYAKTSGDPDWAYVEYKASQTGYVDAEELAKARLVMTADEYEQEYECSFTAAVKGAIYARELEEIRASGRITAVPYDPMLPVDTDWDLGVGDAMAIWFSQSDRSGAVRVIDYHEASGEGFPYYIKILRDKPYVYGTHWAPHDIAVRELGSGKSRLDVAAALGLKFSVTPRITGSAGVEIEEGIAAARLFMGRCWFDQTKCQAGLDALMHYRRDYNQRLNEFKATPVHDWASHGADAFRGLAVRYKTGTEKRLPPPPLMAPGQQGTAWMT